MRGIGLLRIPLIIIINLAAAELIARVVGALYLGNSAVLLYGRDSYRRHDSDVMTAGQPRAGYSTFFPGQIKFHREFAGQVREIRLNNYGFRGGNFSERKAAGVTRIVTLGASSTFGYGVSDGDTYPSQLEVMLNARCRSGMKFEVYNLGIPHLRSENILRLYEDVGVRFKADYVTFYEGNNDAGYPDTSFWLSERWPLSSSSFLVYTVNQAVWVSLAFSQTVDPARVAALMETRTNEFMKNVSGIAHAAAAHGAVFIAANQQLRSSDGKSQGMTYARDAAGCVSRLEAGTAARSDLAMIIHSRIMAALEEWARSSGALFTDVIGALDGARAELMTEVHLSAQGNRFVAAALAAQILPRACGGAILPE